MRAFFSSLKWGDAVIAAGVLLLALAGFWLMYFRGVGNTVVIRSPEQSETLSLSQNTTKTVTGNGYTLTVTVRDGQACISHSDCPNQVCVHTGWIFRAGQSVVCAPAGVVVTVNDDELDGVVR